jgi:hypothetical protein
VAKAVGQLAHLLSDPPSSDRGPYRRDLRRLSQDFIPAAYLRELLKLCDSRAIPAYAWPLWELLELCDSRDCGVSVGASAS